jgi:TPR repeat protein
MPSLRTYINDLLDLGTPEGVEDAKSALLGKAKQGDAEAMLLLMELLIEYEPGEELEAVNWLSKAAEKGSGKAAYLMGRLYGETFYSPIGELKNSVKPDAQISEKWLARAAELKIPDALYALALDRFNHHDYDLANQHIEALLQQKASDDDAELFADANALKEEVKDALAEQQKEMKSVNKVLADPQNATPEELYNAAIILLDRDKDTAKTLLKLAADQGMFAAKKKLSGMKTD